MLDDQEKGIVSIQSKHSTADTVARLLKILEAKGVKIFAIVDHSGEAAKVGLHMPDTKLILFGNPKAGTPLMIAAPTAALDLPLKILVWQDKDARVWVTYNSPESLLHRHGLPPESIQTLAAAGALAAEIAG